MVKDLGSNWEKLYVHVGTEFSVMRYHLVFEHRAWVH